VGEDRTATKHGPDRRRVTVAEASEILGITAEAVRTRIKRGKLESLKDPPAPGGTVYVLLQADQTRPDIDPTVKGHDQTTDQTELVETLREQVAYLQGVIATRDQELALRAEEIRRRDTALEREQQLAAMFADRLQALEAPASSSEARESDVSPGPTGELEEVQEELAAEQDRREMAETTLHEGMAEEQRRREEAERERDDLRRELYALSEPRESPSTGKEEPERTEPQSSTEGRQEGVPRPWWRRVLGR
jgi:vacuolar-type H+-ATPase subunit I/STV1